MVMGINRKGGHHLDGPLGGVKGLGGDGLAEGPGTHRLGEVSVVLFVSKGASYN